MSQIRDISFRRMCAVCTILRECENREKGCACRIEAESQIQKLIDNEKLALLDKIGRRISNKINYFVYHNVIRIVLKNLKKEINEDKRGEK